MQDISEVVDDGQAVVLLLTFRAVTDRQTHWPHSRNLCLLPWLAA